MLDDVPSTDRETLLRAIVDRLALPETFDRELLVEVLRAREGRDANPVADGIAIPHTRHPIIAAGSPPAVTVAYFANAVELDARPVRAMIVIVSPTVRTHLRLLARLARALTDTDLRAALDRRAGRDELVREARRIEAPSAAGARGVIDGAALGSWLVVAAIAIVAASGLPGLARPRHGPAGERLASWLVVLGCAAAIAAGVLALVGYPSELVAGWDVPGGRLRIGIDAVSAMFVIPIALVSALGAIYGRAYWPQRDHEHSGRKLRTFYGVLTAGLVLIVVARNAILFLFAWEVMALAAYFLITTEDEDADVRDVGFVYLLATRLGTLCLFAMFAMLATSTGSLDFDAWRPAFAGPLRDAIFVTAVIGFGFKAGLMPLHVWLPGAHARAPSHVSALMSGVMVKIGIYGIVRITGDVPTTRRCGGEARCVIAGTVSAVLGVALAIGQHDLKRLLAYHSVENIGIIRIGLGVALLGRGAAAAMTWSCSASPARSSTCGTTACSSRCCSSARARSSTPPAPARSTVSAGLARACRGPALAFLVGAVAICGLPPLNGFVSELFIYLGLFRATANTTGARAG